MLITKETAVNTDTDGKNTFDQSYFDSLNADLDQPVYDWNSISTSNKVTEAEVESQLQPLLPVKANIKVWVDLNIPIKEDLCNAMSFPLIKMLLVQVSLIRITL